MEMVILVLMFIFGVVALVIFFHALSLESPDPILLLVEVMILQIIAILGLTFVVLKVWEQHILPDYAHKNSTEFFEKQTKPKKTTKKKSK